VCFEISAYVLKSMFGLLRRSLFNFVHHMTDQGTCLGPSLIVSNIKISDKNISSLEHSTKYIFPPNYNRNVLCPMKYMCRFHSIFEERERNVSCELHQLVKLTFSQLLIFYHLFHTLLLLAAETNLPCICL
jgi:hypothetical protein